MTGTDAAFLLAAFMLALWAMATVEWYVDQVRRWRADRPVTYMPWNLTNNQRDVREPGLR